MSHVEYNMEQALSKSLLEGDVLSSGLSHRALLKKALRGFEFSGTFEFRFVIRNI